MKNLTDRENRTYWWGVGLLFLVALILGARTRIRTQAALAVPVAAMAQTGPAVTDVGSEIKLVRMKTGMAEAGAALERDPFRDPPSTRVAPRPQRVRRPEPEPEPALRALLYDQANPTVQLGISGQLSGWLKAGDEFRGWVIVEIKPSSTTVSKNGRTLVLPSP